jgi:hypothetical protein
MKEESLKKLIEGNNMHVNIDFSYNILPSTKISNIDCTIKKKVK